MPSEELMAKMQKVEEQRQKNKLLDYELKIVQADVEAKQTATRQVQRQAEEMRAQNGAISESVRSIQSTAQESPEDSVLFAVLEQRLADSQAAARERLEAANRIAQQTEQIRAQFEAEKERCEWIRDLDNVNAEHAAAVEQLAESKRELARMNAECDAAERTLKEQAPYELTAWITKMSREALEQKRLRQRLAKLLVFKSQLNSKKKLNDSIDVEMEAAETTAIEAGASAPNSQPLQPALQPALQASRSQPLQHQLRPPSVHVQPLAVHEQPAPAVEQPMEASTQEQADEAAGVEEIEAIFRRPLPPAPKPPVAAAKPPVVMRRVEEPPREFRSAIQQPPADVGGAEQTEDTPLTEEAAPETDSNLLRYVIDGDEDDQEEEDGEEAEVTPQNSPTATSPFELFDALQTPADARSPPNGTPPAPPRSPRPPAAVVADDDNPLGSIDLNVSNQDGSFDFELDGGDLGDFDLNMDFGDAGGGGGGDGGVDISLNFDFDGPAASPQDDTTQPFNFDHSTEGDGGSSRLSGNSGGFPF
ncbi:hypothetical protein M3Y99_00596500 [Aphelenchoides fujianensis]|nr:hypothetical protein M3Y99_00596500 [Aphelenchoides fujianensis]